MKKVGGIVCAARQGLGTLGREFYKHGVIDEVLIFNHPKRENHPEWYPRHSGILFHRPFSHQHLTMVNKFLGKVDTVLFFETPYDWKFVDYCKQQGKKTVLMCMYEWTPKNPPYWFDLILCPSLLDKQYYPTGHYIPVPIPDEIPYTKRQKATKFVYNGGNLGVGGGRGALELFQAIRYVNKEIPFTIRAQDHIELRKLLNTCPWVERLPQVTIECGDGEYLAQWDGQDVLVAPEKFNGLSLPLQEARAAGMFVLTTNRFPTNEWIGTTEMIQPYDYHMGSVGGAYNEIQIAQIQPAEIARAINELYGRNISDYSESAVEWRKSMSWETLKPKYLEVLHGVS